MCCPLLGRRLHPFTDPRRRGVAATHLAPLPWSAELQRRRGGVTGHRLGARATRDGTCREPTEALGLACAWHWVGSGQWNS